MSKVYDPNINLSADLKKVIKEKLESTPSDASNRNSVLALLERMNSLKDNELVTLLLKDVSKKRLVDLIIMGTVIDHIPAGMSYLVEQVLKLETSGLTTIVLRNVHNEDRKKLSKDVLKMYLSYLSPFRQKQLSLVIPGATINFIKDWIVKKKIRILPPKPGDIYRGVVKCQDVDCVSVLEPHQVISEFEVVKYRHLPKDLFLRCVYCEDEMLLAVNQLKFL